jgi:branched-chain amino acid transport system substrate-binding protein
MTRAKRFDVRAWMLSGILALSLAVLGAFSPAANAQEPIKIGFSMTLTGGLAGNGKAALLAMQIWEKDINAKGGLLGRPVQLVYYDDHTNPADVPGIYAKLLDVDKVDLVVSSYGTNLIAPAMPTVMRKKLVFLSLFGLAVNDRFNYDRYFQIMPSGPVPKEDWSRGFFDLAMEQSPKPTTIALLATDSEFAKNAVAGARSNAQRLGMNIVYDNTFPPGTADFSPIMRAIQATNADLIYVGCYPPGAAGIVRAANEIGLKAKMFGGGMVGLQYASLQESLGSMLNGIVNYDFWAPEPTLNFPGVDEFLRKYQAEAEKVGVDPLGYYLPPYAYAYLEVLGQAVNAVGSLDQGKLAEYIHNTTFNTVVGPVKFGKNGEWAQTRTLQVQFQGIKDNDLDQFRQPGKTVILYPKEWKSGKFIYPYNEAQM